MNTNTQARCPVHVAVCMMFSPKVAKKELHKGILRCPVQNCARVAFLEEKPKEKLCPGCGEPNETAHNVCRRCNRERVRRSRARR